MTIVDEFLKSGDVAWALDKAQFNEAAYAVSDTVNCYLVFNGNYFIVNKDNLRLKVVNAGNGTTNRDLHTSRNE